MCVYAIGPDGTTSKCNSQDLLLEDLPINVLLGNLTRLRWQNFQTSHPFTEARIIKVKEAAFQVRSLFCSQSPKLWEPCFLQSHLSKVTILNAFYVQDGISELR